MSRLGKWITQNRVYRSIYRNSYPTDDRNRVLVILNSLALHLHPTRVPKRATDVSYTWGLGGLSIFMFVILTITGIFLMFYYMPSADQAHWSIVGLERNVTMGSFVRNLHRWGGQATAIFVFPHLRRVSYS